MADEQHVEIGEVVFLDDVIVLEREERRPVGAFRQEQRRRLVEFRRGRFAAIGEHKSLFEPIAERTRDLGDADGAVHALRRAHLIGPAHAALPALAGELLRGGGERIGHRSPDILLAVAVEIDGVFVKFGGKELGEAHGAAPGAAHVRELDVALLQHLERVKQLLPEEILPPPVIALRGQHGDGVLRQPVAAERGLTAPDREQDISRHAVLLLDRAQRAAVLGGELFALLGEIRDVRLLDVVGGRLHEFGLPARRRLPAGKIEIGQRQIGLEPARRRVECRPRDAKRLCLRPDLLEPALKRGVGGLRRRENGCRKPGTHKYRRIIANSTHCPLALSVRRQNPAPDPLLAIRCNDSRPLGVNKSAKKRLRYGAADAAGAAGNRLS